MKARFTKYAKQQQVIKDNFAHFDVPYNGADNNDYVDGKGFAELDGSLEGAMLKAAMAQGGNKSAGLKGNFQQNDSYETYQYFYHPDHLGSSSFITNIEGDVVQHIEYVPYGEVFIEERNNVWNTPYLFNAKEFDEETGLYYYGARYYDSRLSMWYGVDALAEKYPNIGGYVYCAGNPVKLVDPDGNDIKIVGDNESCVTLTTDLIDFEVNASSLGVDWGGQYTLEGEDVLSAGLDIVGIFDPTGIADGANAALQAKNGDYLGATISAVGLIPYVGDVAKVGKVGKDIKIIGDAVDVVKSGEKEISTLHRPYIRKSTKDAVPELPKGADGRYIDPRDWQPFDGKPDLGHKPGHEFWREKAKAENEGLTQKQFNDRMNDPNLYQWENPHLNRSHKYERK